MTVRRYDRGQVVYADLEPVVGHEQGGHRPVLIVSEDRFNASSQTVIAMTLTSRKPRAPYPFSFELAPFADGEPTSWVKPTQVRTLSVDRMGRILGAVAPEEVERCLDALMRVCGRKSPTKATNDG